MQRDIVSSNVTTELTVFEPPVVAGVEGLSFGGVLTPPPPLGFLVRNNELPGFPPRVCATASPMPAE